MSGSDVNARKKVAAIVTEYRHNSHAEVIVGRLLGRFGHDPRLEVVSLYTDQVPSHDMSRTEAAEFGIPVCPTIEEAIAAEGRGPVDGVVVIGEHGQYPINEKRQKMYPRRRMMEQVLAALDRQRLRVPVFSDKHLAYDFGDALWIYEEIRSRGIPFLGGSSIPFADRVPHVNPSQLSDLRELLVISFGDTEAYGFHAMEVLQCLAEKRTGGETGVRSVHALAGSEVWAAMDRGEWPEELLLQALAVYPNPMDAHPRARVPEPVLFLIEYNDGTRGYVIQLAEEVEQWAFSARCAAGNVLAARFDSDLDRPFRHFGRLTENIERLVMTGEPPFPMERTLLTTGMIDLGMESLHRGTKLDTPELNIHYKPY